MVCTAYFAPLGVRFSTYILTLRAGGSVGNGGLVGRGRGSAGPVPVPVGTPRTSTTLSWSKNSESALSRECASRAPPSWLGASSSGGASSPQRQQPLHSPPSSQITLGGHSTLPPWPGRWKNTWRQSTRHRRRTWRGACPGPMKHGKVTRSRMPTSKHVTSRRTFRQPPPFSSPGAVGMGPL